MNIKAIESAETEIKRLEKINRELLESCKKAREFIINGVELGYITMPDEDLKDSAHDTLPAIEQAIAHAEPATKREL